MANAQQLIKDINRLLAVRPPNKELPGQGIVCLLTPEDFARLSREGHIVSISRGKLFEILDALKAAQEVVNVPCVEATPLGTLADQMRKEWPEEFDIH